MSGLSLREINGILEGARDIAIDQDEEREEHLILKEDIDKSFSEVTSGRPSFFRRCYKTCKSHSQATVFGAGAVITIGGLVATLCFQHRDHTKSLAQQARQHREQKLLQMVTFVAGTIQHIGTSAVTLYFQHRAHTQSLAQQAIQHKQTLAQQAIQHNEQLQQSWYADFGGKLITIGTGGMATGYSIYSGSIVVGQTAGTIAGTTTGAIAGAATGGPAGAVAGAAAGAPTGAAAGTVIGAATGTVIGGGVFVASAACTATGLLIEFKPVRNLFGKLKFWGN